MDGLLVVDKPAGPTSHDVVARVRRALGEKRIGHTGTLDPAATGVLCLVLGRATRLAQFLSASDKEYEALVRFGFATDTHDAQGRPTTATGGGALPTREAIEVALDAFRGTFMQQPPAYSAKKIDGKRSHRIARASARGNPPGRRDARDQSVASVESVLPDPVSVTVYSLDILSIDRADVTLRLHCSAGFYVRSLAHDLGLRLGVGAHLAALRRTRSGDFTVGQAITLDAIERDPTQATAALVPLAAVLSGLPLLRLTSDGVKRAKRGCDVGPNDSVTGQSVAASPNALCRLVDSTGDLVGIARARSSAGILHPVVVLM